MSEIKYPKKDCPLCGSLNTTTDKMVEKYLSRPAAPTQNSEPVATMCNVCAGDKEWAAKINCICGGVGTIFAEAQGLREALFKYTNPPASVAPGLDVAISREAFESAWAKIRHAELDSHIFEQTTEGVYYEDSTNSAWLGWQAAKGVNKHE